MANERQRDKKDRKVDAIFYHGLTLWDGFWVAGKGQQPGQHNKAVECFKSAAKKGHPRAKYYLGLAYMYDLGVCSRDVHQAVRWFLESAEKDHIDAAAAQFHLGIAYMHALGVPRDDQKAVDWFRKSADQGHAGAQNNLGIMYSEGWGIEKDKEKAIKLFIRAKDNGNEDATVNLGVMYLQNPELASHKERASHDLLCRYKYSNARARYYYWRTLQVESSERDEWMKKAEELGNMKAYYQLMKKEQKYKHEEDGVFIIHYDPYSGLPVDYDDTDDYIYQSLYEQKLHRNQRYASYYNKRVIYEQEEENSYYAQTIGGDALDELREKEASEAKRQKTIQSHTCNWISCILDKANKLDMEETISKQFIDAVINVTDYPHKHGLLENFWQSVDTQYTREKTRKEETDVIHEYYSALISLLMNNIREAEKWFGKVEEKIDGEVADNESREDLRQKISYWRGLMHLQEKSAPGITKQQALEEARKCFESAAKGGLAVAQYEAGLMYRDGIGGEKDPKRAEEWFFRAAEQGYSRAACQLGLMYFREEPRDFQEAKKWFEEAKASVPDNSTHSLTILSDIIRHEISLKRSSFFHPTQKNKGIQTKVVLHLSLTCIYLSDSIDEATRICYAIGNRIFPLSFHVSMTEEWIEEMIEGIGIFFEDPKDSHMEFLEAPIIERKDRSNHHPGKWSVLEWLLSIPEWAGNGEVRNKAWRLLAQYVDFPKHFMVKDVEPHRSRLLIKWILIAAEAGDREKREAARKLLAEHDCSVEKFIWHHIWEQKYSVSARNPAWRDLLRALADSHDNKESREDSTAMYQYYYALSSLFLDITEAKTYFDSAYKKLDSHLKELDSDLRKLRSSESIDMHREEEKDICQKRDIIKRKKRDILNLINKILYWLGHIYLRGDIQEDNYEITKQKILVKAREYFRQSAKPGLAEKSGLAEAQYEIGLMCRDGIGGEKKPKEAERWFNDAAKQGNSRAAYQLGLMYFHGQGEVSQNNHKAVESFKKLLPEKLKITFPEYLLTLEYDRDRVVEFDLAELGHIYREKAWDDLKWHPMIYRDTCWREQADALAHLGFIDLKMNTKEAQKFFEKAAQACHANAMFNLGLMSLKDDDRIRAIEWFEKAWEGDLECDECGPEGRLNGTFNGEKGIDGADEFWGKAASDLHHYGIANRKLREKYYLCSDEHSLKLRSGGDWWPRYRGNWLALHYLEILYRSLGEKERAKSCRERLEMTGFTMPDYSKRI